MDDTLDARIEQAVARAFSAGVGNKRYIDVSRIPLICQSITSIHEDIKAIKETLDGKIVTQEAFWPVKTLVYGITGLLLSGTIGALLMLLVNKGH